jgi:hypothetical protein
VLQAHARVYALAHYKDVGELKNLALERMRITLMRIHPVLPDSHESPNIAQIVQYVYSHTDPLDNSREPMRKLVMRFSADNISTLRNDEDMLALIGDGGDFAKELVVDLTRRIGGPEKAPTRATVCKIKPFLHIAVEVSYCEQQFGGLGGVIAARNT